VRRNRKRQQRVENQRVFTHVSGILPEFGRHGEGKRRCYSLGRSRAAGEQDTRDRAELTKAAKLIRDLGYGRRYDELADAEEAAKGW
jgi:hypothetical protein